VLKRIQVNKYSSIGFTTSTRSGVVTILIMIYPGCDRGYWTSKPPAFINPQTHSCSAVDWKKVVNL
jgi:hypothetical protein